MNQPTPPPLEKPQSLATGLMLVLGVVAGLLRWIPHPAGVSAVGALGLFGGGRLKSWQAFLYPILVLVVTDLGLFLLTGQQWYAPWHATRLFVYPCFLVYVAIGRWLVANRNLGAITLAGLLGSLQFFLITNFFEWVSQPFRGDDLIVLRYSRDWAGLMNCYIAALPFYDGQWLTDPNLFVLGHPSYSLYGMVLSDIVFTVIWCKAHDALTAPSADSVSVPDRTLATAVRD